MGGMSEQDARDRLQEMLERHGETVAEVAAQADALLAVARLIVETAHAGGKVLTCGNGGSAADAQHLAAELVGRFEGTRMSLPCVAMSADSAVTTALANDYGYENVFAQQVSALGRRGDLLIALSTSGTSANVVAAALEARRLRMAVAGFVGSGAQVEGAGGLFDVAVVSASTETPRIQEAHGFALHALCELVRCLNRD